MFVILTSVDVIFSVR